MRRVLFTVILLLLASGFGRVQAQLINFGINISYDSKDLNQFLNHEDPFVATDATISFFQQGNLGLMFQLNFSKHILLQTEAHCGINSLWDEVETNANFVEKANMVFNNFQTVELAIPILATWRPIYHPKGISMRLYAGPEFYSTLRHISEIDLNRYSIVAGIGFDIYKRVSLDFRASKLQASDMGSDGTIFSRVAFGFMF